MELTVDGRRVFAVTGGRPLDRALPSVVFLHGNAMDHTAWALLTRYFAHHGRNALAVDLPGHGRSEGPLLPSIPALADWVMRVLDAAGLDKAALVGHSMGGLIALDAAARYADRVWALGLLAVAVPMRVNPDYLALAAANDHRAVELMNDWAVSRRSHIGGNRVPGLWLIGENTRLIERAARGVMAADLRASNDYAVGVAAARKVRCPVLLLLGDADLMTPLRATSAFAKEFQSAEVVVLKDCGHMLMGERPDETLDALRELV
jgi:pimeloyl-ACP methyl ester carboxylesterase